MFSLLPVSIISKKSTLALILPPPFVKLFFLIILIFDRSAKEVIPPAVLIASYSLGKTPEVLVDLLKTRFSGIILVLYSIHSKLQLCV